MTPFGSLALCASGALIALGAGAAEPMILRDYLALNGPAPSAKIPYGSSPSQYVELFEPTGAGPFPVAVLVHGGCWKVKFGGIEQMRNIAGALMLQGIAVWSIEYRRLDETGGGYPGTYLDMNSALELLATRAGDYRLDTGRIVAIGHSAGGFLVQWASGRTRIPNSSPLFAANPLAIGQVINLGGLNDLRRDKKLFRSSCGVDVSKLTGEASQGRADVFADTNPAELIPNGSHTVLINGEFDTIAPPQFAVKYASRARKAGDIAKNLVLPGASHYDEVATSSPSWQLVLPIIRKALNMQPAQ